MRYNIGEWHELKKSVGRMFNDHDLVKIIDRKKKGRRTNVIIVDEQGNESDFIDANTHLYRRIIKKSYN